jgi:hypothetical protein
MDSDLYFEAELRKLVNLFYGANWKGDVADDVKRNAMQGHAYKIFDACRDTFLDAIELASRVRRERARYFLLFGVARRLEMVWFAYRDLVFTAPVERTQPLDSDESRRLTQDINTIYINLRGSLDNLCWALLHEFAPDTLASFRESQIQPFFSVHIRKPRIF